MKKVLLFVSALAILAACSPKETQTFIDIKKIDPSQFELKDFERNGDKGLDLTATAEKAELSFVSEDEPWNLLGWTNLILEVENRSDREQYVESFFDSFNYAVGVAYIPPHTTKEVGLLFLNVDTLSLEAKQFPGVHGYPAGRVWRWSSPDPSALKKIRVSFPLIQAGDNVVLKSAVLKNRYTLYTDEEYQEMLPFVDKYGQGVHEDFPGKISTDEELIALDKAEDEMISADPRDPEWDQYGGWAAGPQLEATGHFRVQKYEGKWWLVDPEGRLFWSHGINCFRQDIGESSPMEGREHLYEFIPQEGDPLYQFIRQNSSRGTRTISFLDMNRYRKWGDEWLEKSVDKGFRRMGYWRINTVGNWSDRQFTEAKRAPYTANFGARNKGNLTDYFDPEFAANFERTVSRGRNLDDPWCIGYFVDNEIPWGTKTSLAEGAVKGTYPFSKKEMEKYLKGKYGTPAALNAVWGSDFKTWADFQSSTEIFDGAKEDLEYFTRVMAEEYFKVVSSTLKKYAPNKLYLGSRVNVGDYLGAAWQFVVEISSKYCDVVTLNRYYYTLFSFREGEGYDFPTMIGEFHFGAIDTGMWHPGLCYGYTQENRADLYKHFVMDALKDSHFVGTHWFQYNDQPLIGRFDGENYNIGFINHRDAPNQELVDAAREVGSQMYHIRYGK